jgi:hypothetical protein
MKNLLLLVALLTSGISAALAQSVLKVRLADNSPINIALNGRYFEKTGQTITVGDLPPGRQRLKIYSISRTRWGSAHEDMIYQGTVHTSPGMVTMFVYDPFTRETNVQDQDMNQPVQENFTPPTNSGNGQPENNYGNGEINVQAPLPEGTPVASPIAEGKTGTLTDAKIEKLKTQADAKNSDTDKMKVLKSGLKDEQITTFDVSRLMDLFLFESSKVDFAAWAYNITVDHELYHDLDAKLKNAGAKEDLDKFINSKQ